MKGHLSCRDAFSVPLRSPESTVSDRIENFLVFMTEVAIQLM